MRRGRATEVVKKKGLGRYQVVGIERALYEIVVRALRGRLESRERAEGAVGEVNEVVEG